MYCEEELIDNENYEELIQFLNTKDFVRETYECIKRECEGTDLFNNLTEEELLDFLFPDCTEENF